MVDFGTFKIVDIIMHRVPRALIRDDSARPIELSEAPIELSATDRGYLELRLRRSLSGYARPVVENSEEDSPTPALVKQLLEGGGDLVEDSQMIARRLRECQAGISPDGLLVLIDGTLGSDRCILVAKVEHEEGVRVEQTRTADGRLTYKTEYLKDLIFGQGNRVFKVGVFAEIREDGLLSGEVVDIQQGQHGVASFFLNRVLGCQFIERPDVLTQRFFSAAEKWINRVSDAEKAARYEVALLAEMQSASRNLFVQTFASQHIDADDQDAFIAVMEGSSVPLRSVPKDVSLVATQIRRVKVQTTRNASVYVPPEMYDDGSLTITKADDGVASDIHLRDEVKSITGASGRRGKVGR